ncbi:AraC family transcriptional activator of pobA [Pseudochelatococcus lubricantis]|uniref:AraC family transcriptional activator of pobA n=1 Tax=Pseudochelatococcus lubricantis TaxID=1538102 RepID=A0ABX0V3X7_9HYPH|nr:helix-turn-helix domain-containing protein [Pseudochelatococcus lubricantis]NIJ59927.1 AraC family transcriptional activator of pobA [Pseudochelatococcus lubricantis]
MRREVPTYELYGERPDDRPDFWLHCETLFSRSSLHRFEIGLHRHDSFFQLLHIESGTGSANFDGVQHAFETPAAIVVPPGFSHGFAFSNDIVGHIVTVLVPEVPLLASSRNGPLSRWLRQPQLVALRGADPSNLAYIGATVARIMDEFSGRKPNKTRLLEAYFVSALMLVARAAGADDADGRAAAQRDARLEQLLELIDRHFREHRPVSFYADALNISPTHLNRIAQAAAGLTTQQLLIRKLIDTARRDLVVTPTSVQNIAYGLGFTDPAYFSRMFQREVGVTPRRFRLEERARLVEASAASSPEIAPALSPPIPPPRDS